MIDKFIRKIESLTKEQISACLLVVLLAGFSLGFGKGVENSIVTNQQMELKEK